MARIIPLTKDRHALVDDADYEWLSQYKWTAAEGRNEHFYAQTQWPVGKLPNGKTKYKTREMQRIILDPDDTQPRSIKADHRNHDTQDNCRANLRWLSDSESNLHRRFSRKASTGYRGVWKRGSRYRVVFSVDGVRIRGGSFKTPEEAALRYNELARQYHGEFAFQNIIKPAA